ncbi:MAG: hypothetical protein IKW15_05130 [Bacteroidales bacterium]|nr:hypothetical protein [Bacteroidales bacterium]
MAFLLAQAGACLLGQAGAFLLRTGYFLGAGGDISWGQAGKHLISRAKSTAEAIRAENNTKTRAEPPKSTIRTEKTPNSRAKPTNSIIRAENTHQFPRETTKLNNPGGEYHT